MLMCDLCRRSFIRGAAALGAAGASGSLFASPLMAQTQGPAQTQGQAQAPAAGAAPRLPPRGEFPIVNAYVLSMDDNIGDVAGGSVHVKNGAIVAAGKDVAGGGQRIDANGMIVMPGLVDTHWHMWNTIFRSFSG